MIVNIRRRENAKGIDIDHRKLPSSTSIVSFFSFSASCPFSVSRVTSIGGFDCSRVAASVETVPFDVVGDEAASIPFFFFSFATTSSFTSLVTGVSSEGRVDGGGEVTLTRELFVDPRRAASANRSLRVFFRTGPVVAGGGDDISGREDTDEGR